MKKKMLFLPLMAALLFSACSQDEDNTGTNGSGGDSKTSYLTVNLVAAPSMGTRAPGDNDFEDGLETENTVNSVRFYFFHKDGTAAAVKGGNQSYYDWNNPTTTPGEKPNVEKKLSATIIIESPADGSKDAIPASVVAVINPTNEVKAVNVKKLGDLSGITQDFSTTSSFVMSNSVYANGTFKMDAVDVSEHIFPTKEAALEDPVAIYVERVLAKVRLGVGFTGTPTAANGTIYPTSTTENEQKFEDKDIYVKFLGWNVTATADKSYLMKSINTGWPSDLFGNAEPWNFAEYFRSFWAVNPGDLNYKYGAFDTEATGHPNTADFIKDFEQGTGKKNYTYVAENAAKGSDIDAKTDNPTKVIIAAQLVDKDGNPLTIAEWAGNKYNIEDLKKELASHAPLWKDDMVEDPETGEQKPGRVKVTPEEIILKTAMAVGEAAPSTSGRYYVYAQITEETFNQETWYADDNVGTEDHPEWASNSIDLKTANEQLKKAGPAKVWNEGRTYYYFDIKHLGADGQPGQYGVVRNHLYNATITKLAGLGTPVYDPEEVIYPEKPTDDNQYIAAKINILSWRLVPSNVELEW